MPLLRTLKFIATHPLNTRRRAAALWAFFRWQIGGRLAPGDVVYDWVNGARFLVRPGETGLTGNIYYGLHEFADMAYVLHAVSEEDMFVDVGANVGSYTILACAARGARGFCFEPVPATYRRLLDNLRLNDLSERVRAFNIGLSDREGELVFTAGENCSNHVVADGEGCADPVTVPARPLDGVLAGESPSVLKIDVEGFETLVLRGARETLRNASLHSVIMELNGSGARYGFSDGDLRNAMETHGFSPYAYEPFSRALTPLEGCRTPSGNTLFVRNLDTVRERIANAPKATIDKIRL